MKRLFLLALGTLFTAGLMGCSETKPVSQQDQVSSIPWNRPEKWEGQGAMGGFSGTQ